MKATILYLPSTDHPYTGWLTMKQADGIIVSIRNDYVKIPYEDLTVGMKVELSFKENGMIMEVNRAK